MFNKIVLRRITAVDDLSGIKVLRHRLVESIQEGLAYGAFYKRKLVSYIAPVNLNVAPRTLLLSCVSEDELSEVKKHMTMVKNVYCITHSSGKYILDLLNVFANEIDKDSVTFTPYYTAHKEFVSAGYSRMTLNTSKREILIK